jgi:hypothetical protein
MLEIERDRHYEEMRPQLEGRVVPATGQGDQFPYRLEVWLKTSQPLLWVTLNVHAHAGFYRGSPNMAHLLSYPVGEGRSTIRTGEVISWPVGRSEDAHGTVTVIARCRGEYGTLWEGIEVPIDLGSPELPQTGP